MSEEAELYDRLQGMFGIGDWDEATSEVPWWKFRNTEIAKLKAMMKRRGASVVQVLTAADYASTTSRPIRASYQLFELIPEAMRWRRERLAVTDTTDLDSAITEAIDAGEYEWADRLIRAQDTQTVITQWRNSR